MHFICEIVQSKLSNCKYKIDNLEIRKCKLGVEKKIIDLHNSIYTNKTNINGNKTLNDGFFFSVKKFHLNKKGNFNSIKDGWWLKGVGGRVGVAQKDPF